jgi:hypothetical protein
MRLGFRYIWDIIAQITGRPVKFKHIDGEGLIAILVDRNKPQINGFADDMSDRLKALPESHPACQDIDLDCIAEYFVRVCNIHVKRYVLRFIDKYGTKLYFRDLEALRKKGRLTEAEYRKVWTVTSIKTPGEWASLLQWGKNNQNQHIKSTSVSNQYFLSVRLSLEKIFSRTKPSQMPPGG